jgi:hypothetical protein
VTVRDRTTCGYCPLKFNVANLPGDSYLCELEDCAWWNKDSDQCAVVDIAFILRNEAMTISGSVETFPSRS